jgi:hypothetical protein
MGYAPCVATIEKNEKKDLAVESANIKHGKILAGSAPENPILYNEVKQ